MSDFNFLKMYADAAALRIAVLVNRLDCKTARERALHDHLEKILTEFIAYTRETLAAERRFSLNTDPAKVDELGEDRWSHHDNYDYYWCEPTGSSLWDHVPIEMLEFRRILGEVRNRLGIYLDATNLELPEEEHPVLPLPPVAYDSEDIDDECYEDLHGYDEGEEFSAIHVLVNGDHREA